MTSVAVTGLAVGFVLGIAATHAAQNFKRRMRRKVNSMLKSTR